MSKFVPIIIGAVEVAAGVVLDVFTGFGGTWLIIAGAGTIAGGIGTLLNQPQQGLATASKNPIAPWNSVYGRAKVGGTVVYVGSFGDSDKYLDLVFVLACHPCEAVDALLFDDQRVLIDPTTKCSFPPTQATVSLSSISRTFDVVTVILATSITGLEDGDFIQIKNVSGDQSLNGRYPITAISSTSFSYINGGAAGTYTGTGQAETTWPNYRSKVYMEVLDGTQTATFDGMLTGTPYDGDLSNLVTNGANPWTSEHLLLGKCCVMLRLHYNDEVFSAGLPNIAFRMRGKNDILDPRPSPMTNGYSENAALCIADYLAQPTWGLKAAYGTEIPYPQLISAANICSEPVALATGINEGRYLLNGAFQLSTKRGEVLQNMLTSCGGRLTYVGGEFVIWPAAWPGSTLALGGTTATLNVLTSHTQGGGPGALVSNNIVSLFNRNNGWPLFNGSGDWTLRTDSTSIDTATLAELVVFFTMSTQFPGAVSPHEVFLVYDCWVDVTYPDGTTATIRPTVATAEELSQGTIANPANAIDGNPATDAALTKTSASTLDFSPVLRLSGFVQPTTPNLSPGGITSSTQVLAIAAGAFQWKEKLSSRDLFNGVKGTFISPVNNWNASDFPPYAQDTDHGYASGSPMVPFGDANLAADGGDRRWLDIQLPFTVSVAAAQRLAKIELLRHRQQGTGTFLFNMALYRTTVLDVIVLTLPVLGWYGKLLEITAHRFTLNRDKDGAVLLGTELDLQETDSSVYDWSTSEELSAQGFQQPLFPNTQSVSAPSSVTATSGSGVASVGADGVSTSRIQINFTPPSDAFVLNGGSIETQYQAVGATTWTSAPSTTPLSTTTGSTTTPVAGTVYIDGVSDGTAYNVRVRAVSAAGPSSDWATVGPVTASGSSLTLRRIDDEIPTGTINGSNATFTLSHVPSPSASLQLFRNGDLAIQGLDYTLGSPVSNTITWTTAPLTNDSLRAFYWY